MNKKKEASTAIMLAEPTVNQNINLNLSQNDIIDIAIQENLSILEKQIEAEELRMKANSDVYSQIRQDLITKYANMKLEEHTCFQEFLKTIKKSRIPFKRDDVKIRSDYSESTTIGTCRQVDFVHVENYKDPVRWAKKNTTDKNIGVGVPTSICVSAGGEHDGLSINFDLSLETPEDWRADTLKKLTPIVKDEIEIKERLYDLRMKNLDFSYGEKKIKAQVMKAALSNSEQGRAVLALLEKATNTKLLA